MAWMKIETSVPRNKKFLDAGPAASWLWLCGVAYCKEGLTDGFIPFHAVRYLGVKSPTGLITKLVRTGLWETCDGGWRIHDFLKHNKPAVEILGLMEERRENGAKGGRASGQARRFTDVMPERHGEAHECEPSKQVASATAEAPPENTSKQAANPEERQRREETEERQRETAPARGAPIHDTAHKKHALCGRICLHASLFGDFVRRRNHPDADQEIRRWAAAIIDAWTDGPHAGDEPGDAFDFWRAQYATQWPSTVPAVRPPKGLPAWAQ